MMQIPGNTEVNYDFEFKNITLDLTPLCGNYPQTKIGSIPKCNLEVS